MKAHIRFTLVAIAILVSGCHAMQQRPVEIGQDTLGPQKGRIGVVMTALPKVDTSFPGAGCLLCIAAASVANSSLTAYANTLSYEDLPKLKNGMADLLRKKGVEVVVIAEDLDMGALADTGSKAQNVATKDFMPLQQKYKVDKLLVIHIADVGFQRTYSSYIPTGDPKGVVRGVGYIVNLNNNTYEWYKQVNVFKSAEGSWDEPPKFPGLTNAYFQALEMGKDEFLEPFKN